MGELHNKPAEGGGKFSEMFVPGLAQLKAEKTERVSARVNTF
jgi:hypothetical protein